MALSLGVRPKGIFTIPIALSSGVIVASGDILVLIYYNQRHLSRCQTPGLRGTTVNPSIARYFAYPSSEEIQRCFGGAVRRSFNGKSSIITCYTSCKGGTIIRLAMIPGATYSLWSSFDLYGGARGKRV